MIDQDFSLGGRFSFSPGQIVLGKRASRKLFAEDVVPAVSRHIFGDWGKVTPRRRSANRTALYQGKPLYSVYFSSDGVKFSVTTNASRSVTRVEVV